MITAEERAVLAAERAERAGHETILQLRVSLSDLQDLAAGTVPRAVRAQAQFGLDTDDIDRRRAARPYRSVSKRKRR